MHLKKAPIRTPNRSSVQHGIRNNWLPTGFIGSMPISGNNAPPPWAGGASRGVLAVELLRPLPPWVGSVCEAHAQLPLVSSTHGWTAQARLQQVLDKADAIVPEHHAIAFLSCVKIDIGANGEIMVAIGITKGLLHMPHALRFLVGFIDSQKRH